MQLHNYKVQLLGDESALLLQTWNFWEILPVEFLATIWKMIRNIFHLNE